MWQFFWQHRDRLALTDLNLVTYPEDIRETLQELLKCHLSDYETDVSEEEFKSTEDFEDYRDSTLQVQQQLSALQHKVDFTSPIWSDEEEEEFFSQSAHDCRLGAFRRNSLEMNIKPTVYDSGEESGTAGVYEEAEMREPTPPPPPKEEKPTPVNITNIYNTYASETKEARLKATGSYPTGKTGEPNTERFKHKDKPLEHISNRGVWLDVDNSTNRREAISNWVKACDFMVAATMGDQNNEGVHNFFIATLRGKAEMFWNNFTKMNEYAPFMDSIKNSRSCADFAVPIYMNFVGNLTNLSKEVIERAKKLIQNISLHDIGELDGFFSEFELYFLQINDITNRDYLELFIQKIPYPWGDALMKEYKKGLTYNTLGELKQKLDTILAEACDSLSMQRSIKKVKKSNVSRSFCNKISGVATHWGERKQPSKTTVKYKKKSKASHKKCDSCSTKKHHKVKKWINCSDAAINLEWDDGFERSTFSFAQHMPVKLLVDAIFKMS
ncbi:hypothetical protein SUGI_0670210 [Cryptomeria japonica]|nr:hypothetical protein SUGI_0670210 [Cryptomeria japonica]